jgi:uncharacterized protein (TIGR00251 family)
MSHTNHNDNPGAGAFFEWQGDNLMVNIRVQPRAASNGFAEVLGEEVKLRITAPPVDGKANLHLIAFLARTFRVARADITIIAGARGRSKRVRIRAPGRLPAIFGSRS